MNIKLLQTDLKAAGLYNGTIDGIWGPKTEAAYTAMMKTKIYEGSTFPYDEYKTVTVTLNASMATRYLPAIEKLNLTKGMELLATVMASQEGYYIGSRSYKTNNPGNIGNTDTGAHRTFATLEGGIQAQAEYIKRVAVGQHPAYPLGKVKTLKPYYSDEIQRNLKNYAAKSGYVPGYRFQYRGELSQFIKVYATLPRISNTYLNTIVSFFAQNGITITPSTTIPEVIV